MTDPIQLKSALQKELLQNILPYWMQKMPDNRNGGFYGRIDGNEVIHLKANKGAILNARLLWTFAAAYRMFRNPEYLKMAERAYRYLCDIFLDKTYGGVYWEVDYLGNPVNTKKQTYAQGFALYGISEFYRATGSTEALELAVSFFRLIEKHACDPLYGGYLEAFSRDWNLIEDMRLSSKDANEKKSMNTHLHILEPYTNLYRIWRDPELEAAQRKLIRIFTDNILNAETSHLNLFFDEQWNPKSTGISFGHDIEAAWLLNEAAEILEDPSLQRIVQSVSFKIVDAALQGLQPDGSMIYETRGSHYDMERHWWVQAETVVGLFHAFRNSGNQRYLAKAEACWRYIYEQMIDRVNGEWFWSVDSNRIPNREEDKAGFWKCPYHNARMCMEINLY